ncbi:monocarboxylate transporter 14 [Amyelois transitella]|uniref:monocarboxylate transporter 14 n=1 Tax=Amyelois transitella TaxID=680683 RepID=UPI00298FD571|nr:monocarboxylate transporter 14 [Amyelois transitella]XP_060804643.1 monocarboxylate transporter 14 [Amyelois transitella]
MTDGKDNESPDRNSHSNKHEEDMNTVNSLKSEENEILAHYTKENVSPPVERVKFEGLDDKDSICSDESDSEKLPPIPDGGWGWVVVVSAFLVSACADGLAFSFGLLHEEFTNYFETTQSKTSLIGSLFIATPLLAGPIMSALVDRYGCRIMTMIAGILSTIGFLLAAISNSVAMLCLTFGFMSGLAMGILYVTAVVSVAFWFDKRRNLAVSLASCGIGFGTLIYSPMTQYFLQQYDWRNTVILLAGTLLNMCVCGALMRNPEWLKIKMKRQRKLSKARSRRSSSGGSVSSRSVGGESVYLDSEELKSLLKSGKSPEYILATLAESIAEAEKLENTTQLNAEPTYKRMHSAIHLPTFVQQREKVPTEVIEKLMNNTQLYNIILENYPDLLTRRKSEAYINTERTSEETTNETPKLPVQIKIKKPKDDSELNKNRHDTAKSGDGENEFTENNKDESAHVEKSRNKSHHHHHHTSHRDVKDPPPSTNWITRQISTDHHYLKDMPLYRNTIMYRGAMMNIPRYKLRASSLPDIYRNSMWSIGSESDEEMRWYHHFWDTVKNTFDFKMFTEFHFLMFNLSSLILSVWFIVPYFFLKSYMTESSMDGGAMMISIIGVASAIGIVVLGWAGDQPWVHVTKTYAICLTICGLSVAAYPIFITNYWALTVISAIFGLSFASSYSYTPAILMELMPIDHFTIAYGLILLSQGIGHLVGPPIGGMLYDLTGSWDLTFYMGGLWLVISGVCIAVIAYTDDVRMCGRAQLLKEAEAEKTESEAVIV